jgi:PKD repeat protein
MIFPILKSDSVVQVSDKIRFDASASFVNGDPVDTYEIDAGDGYVDVSTDKILDWAYTAAGTKTVSLRLTRDLDVEVVVKQITVLTALDDRLFSSDKDLVAHEANIFDYLPKGFSSFNHVHRSAQQLILDSLSQRGYYTDTGVPLNKNDLFNVEEVKQWSKFLVLSMIFSNAQNEVGDFFAQKSQTYKDLSERSASRAFITLDPEQSGSPEQVISLTSGRLVRR